MLVYVNFLVFPSAFGMRQYGKASYVTVTYALFHCLRHRPPLIFSQARGISEVLINPFFVGQAVKLQLPGWCYRWQRRTIARRYCPAVTRGALGETPPLAFPLKVH